MRVRASLLAVLLLVVAAPAAVAPGAQAQTPPPIPDITPTVAGTSPWDAVRSGGYSNTSYDALARRLAWHTDSQLAAKSGLTQTQRRYAVNRLATAASKGRLLPALRTAAPFLRLGVGAGSTIAAGVVVYQIVSTWNSQPETVWFEFDQADLGGARVWVPGCGEPPCEEGASFWRVVPDSGAGVGKFGWGFTTTLLDANGAQFSGWSFRYATEIAWGDSTEPAPVAPYPQWGHPNSQIPPFPEIGTLQMEDTVPANPCLISFTQCYALPAADGTVNQGTQLAIAATKTALELDGNLTPLLVTLDKNSTGDGHVKDNSACNQVQAGALHPCYLPYVREADMERHAPRDVREAAPQEAPEKTTTYNPPYPLTPGDWDNITDELTDQCGRALFNHLAMPSQYSYAGCFEGEDPEADPEPIPATELLPRPNPNETYSAYVARLRGLGFIGTITSVTEGTALEGYGPDSPTRVILRPGTATQTVLDPISWPSPAPSVETGTAIRIRINPPTATEVPTGPPPPPAGSDDPATDCPCPIHALNFSPLAVQNVCDKAPFGVFCWVEDQISLLFGASAIAPAVAFAPGALATPLGPIPAGTFDFAIDLADMPPVIDDFMDVVRLVLAFAVWLLGLWFMGRRMLQRNDTLDAEPPVESK